MTIAALGLPFADSTRVPCPLLGRRDSHDLRASSRGDLAKQDANVAVWWATRRAPTTEPQSLASPESRPGPQKSPTPAAWEPPKPQRRVHKPLS
ncbi:hypothetical protein EI555_012650 [Monodon monoceros]|uniref:Uncharacterized protein n=1 Tax=Monodon monoceros TaxID=40151 RepID=A0A4U1EWT8_MONMO|nr:hypothetical protein EI555_012650 [Monodon monoceros]